jgi:hypothetical protein
MGGKNRSVIGKSRSGQKKVFCGVKNWFRTAKNREGYSFAVRAPSPVTVY